MTREEARETLAVSKRTFERLVSKGLPRKGEGRRERFPWPEIQRWAVDQARQEGRESVRPQDYEDAKARKMMAEAEIAEYDLALRRHEIMPVADGEKAIGEAFDRVRGQLLSLPKRVAHELVGIQTNAEASARLTQAVSELMADLRRGDDVPLEEEDPEEPEQIASAAPNAKRGHT